MRLHDTHDRAVYGTQHQDVLQTTSADGDSFAAVGRLPSPATGRETLTYRLKTARYWKTALAGVVGSFPSVNVWPLSESELLAAADRWLFVSADGGETWSVSHELPVSSGPMGVLPPAVCQTDEAVYLGEYPLGSTVTPRVLRSTDRGQTWSPALQLDDVRHIHAVQVDPYTDELWLTTGDTDSECRIGRIRDGEFEVVGSGSQRWRAVELAFTQDAILWGMDSVYAETNRILKLPRTEFETDSPSPETVHTVDSSIYYSTTLTVDGNRWVIFSTAMEAGGDSTGPDEQSVESGPAVVVAASSASDFTDWYELASYRRRQAIGDYVNPGKTIPRSNAYVFLATYGEDKLLLNPYNTATDDGRIFAIEPDQFRRLQRDPADQSGQPEREPVSVRQDGGDDRRRTETTRDKNRLDAKGR